MSLAGVVLAAGLGTRLRPLTDLRAKALCPVGGVPLLDHALARLAPHTADLAVNANYHAESVVAHVGTRAHVSLEQPHPLGTAGALGRLRPWLDGRDVLLTNADSYLPGGLGLLVDGWDGMRCRLLVQPVPVGASRDFDRDGVPVDYVGAALLPGPLVRRLSPTPSGLYEVLWRDLDARGELDLVVRDDVAIDCGTPPDYLAANLHASGGASVIGAGAVVEGSVRRCVVWDGAYVGPDEHLLAAVRAGSREHPVTVSGA